MSPKAELTVIRGMTPDFYIDIYDISIFVYLYLHVSISVSVSTPISISTAKLTSISYKTGCEYHREINTKLTLSWSQKQFANPVYSSRSLYMPMPVSITLSVSLALSYLSSLYLSIFLLLPVSIYLYLYLYLYLCLSLYLYWDIICDLFSAR